MKDTAKTPIKYNKSIQWLAEQAVIDVFATFYGVPCIYICSEDGSDSLVFYGSKPAGNSWRILVHTVNDPSYTNRSEFRNIRDYIIESLRKLVAEEKIKARDEEVEKIFSYLWPSVKFVKKFQFKGEDSPFEWKASEDEDISGPTFWTGSTDSADVSRIMKNSSFANAPYGFTLKRPFQCELPEYCR